MSLYFITYPHTQPHVQAHTHLIKEYEPDAHKRTSVGVLMQFKFNHIIKMYKSCTWI